MMPDTAGAILPSIPRSSGKWVPKNHTMGIRTRSAPALQLTMVQTVFCLPFKYPFKQKTMVTST